MKDNLKWWLLDPREIDQYDVRYGDQTEVFWNDLKPGAEPESVTKRQVCVSCYDCLHLQELD